MIRRLIILLLIVGCEKTYNVTEYTNPNVYGCTDSTATNFDSTATIFDNTCDNATTPSAPSVE